MLGLQEFFSASFWLWLGIWWLTLIFISPNNSQSRKTLERGNNGMTRWVHPGPRTFCKDSSQRLRASLAGIHNYTFKSLSLRTVNYKLTLAKSIASDWTTKAFALCLCKDWTLCCCCCCPSTPTERVQGGVRHSVFQGIWPDKSLDSWVFSGPDFRIPSLHLLIFRRALNPFLMTSAPCDWQKTFCKTNA